MRWLGLDWDEGPDVGGPHGPYFQTQRLELYREQATRLIRDGHAYRCYCSKDDLQRAREAFASTGTKDQFRYPGTCRDKPDEPNRPHVVRFRSRRPESRPSRIWCADESRFPTARSRTSCCSEPTASPTIGAVVDDVTMDVNLIARGDDHIVNTPPQLLLYDALKYPRPTIAHLPMILAPNGEKLSKRHAAVSVLDYREQGYLPDAVLNYLARLGWSHGDQEVFSRSELIAKFNWQSVGKTAGKYDAKKFSFVQAEHLRAVPDAELAEQVVPFLRRRGVETDARDERLLGASIHSRARARSSARGCGRLLPARAAVHGSGAHQGAHSRGRPVLRALADEIRAIEPFEALALKHARRPGSSGPTFRSRTWRSLRGRSRAARGAGLFEVMFVLDPAHSLASSGPPFSPGRTLSSPDRVRPTWNPPHEHETRRSRFPSSPSAFFLETWQRMDEEAPSDRGSTKSGKGYDFRPLLVLASGRVPHADGVLGGARSLADAIVLGPRRLPDARGGSIFNFSSSRGGPGGASSATWFCRRWCCSPCASASRLRPQLRRSA